jgi:hypothetical protein
MTCLAFAFESAIQPSTQLTMSLEGDNNEYMNRTTPIEEQEEVVEVEAEEITGDQTTIIGWRGPLAEIMYKLVHLTPFHPDGWFLFIGTSVRNQPQIFSPFLLLDHDGHPNKLTHRRIRHKHYHFFGML